MLRNHRMFDKQPTVDDIAECARTGTDFESTWVYGYRTDGGTYIVCGHGLQFDDGLDRDTAAITRFGQVYPLTYAVNPEWFEDLVRSVETTRESVQSTYDE